jgi:cell wall-associated NlpC family hydrolase
VSKRTLAVEYGKHFIGTPYEWGDQDHTGMDCSGFITEVLRGTGVIGPRERPVSWQLAERFPRSAPVTGAIACYGTGRTSHVMLCVDGSFVMGASGGGSDTTTPEMADKGDAFVMIRPLRYRKDFLFCVDPFDGEL